MLVLLVVLLVSQLLEQHSQAAAAKQRTNTVSTTQHQRPAFLQPQQQQLHGQGQGQQHGTPMLSSPAPSSTEGYNPGSASGMDTRGAAQRGNELIAQLLKNPEKLLLAAQAASQRRQQQQQHQGQTLQPQKEEPSQQLQQQAQHTQQQHQQQEEEHNLIAELISTVDTASANAGTGVSGPPQPNTASQARHEGLEWDPSIVHEPPAFDLPKVYQNTASMDPEDQPILHGQQQHQPQGQGGSASGVGVEWHAGSSQEGHMFSQGEPVHQKHTLNLYHQGSGDFQSSPNVGTAPGTLTGSGGAPGAGRDASPTPSKKRPIGSMDPPGDKVLSRGSGVGAPLLVSRPSLRRSTAGPLPDAPVVLIDGTIQLIGDLSLGSANGTPPATPGHSLAGTGQGQGGIGGKGGGNGGDAALLMQGGGAKPNSLEALRCEASSRPGSPGSPTGSLKLGLPRPFGSSSPAPRTGPPAGGGQGSSGGGGTPTAFLNAQRRERRLLSARRYGSLQERGSRASPHSLAPPHPQAQIHTLTPGHASPAAEDLAPGSTTPDSDFRSPAHQGRTRNAGAAWGWPEAFPLGSESQEAAEEGEYEVPLDYDLRQQVPKQRRLSRAQQGGSSTRSAFMRSVSMPVERPVASMLPSRFQPVSTPEPS